MRYPIYGVILHYRGSSRYALVEAPDFLSARIAAHTAVGESENPGRADMISFHKNRKEYRKVLGFPPEKSGIPYIRVTDRSLSIRCGGKTCRSYMRKPQGLSPSQ